MIDLNQFCSKMHGTMREPFSHGEYSYACDGYMLIRVPRRDDIIRRLPEVLSKFDEIKIGNRPANVNRFPAFEPPKMVKCKICHGAKKTVICPECAGTELWVGNDFHEYEVECKTCHGYGVIPNKNGEPCENCNGIGEVDSDRWDLGTSCVDVGGLIISKTLLQKVKNLPGICVGPPSPGDKYLRIFFDSGDGAIMAHAKG